MCTEILQKEQIAERHHQPDMLLSRLCVQRFCQGVADTSRVLSGGSAPLGASRSSGWMAPMRLAKKRRPRCPGTTTLSLIKAMMPTTPTSTVRTPIIAAILSDWLSPPPAGLPGVILEVVVVKVSVTGGVGVGAVRCSPRTLISSRSDS